MELSPTELSMKYTAATSERSCCRCAGSLCVVKGGDSSGRGYALLSASEAGDARLLRHVWAAHLHRVYEGNGCWDQMPRRRPASAQRPDWRDEAGPDFKELPSRSRRRLGRYPYRVHTLWPSVPVAALGCSRLRCRNLH